MNDARHIDCTLAEYHARDEWSHSQAKLLPDQPALFHGRHITGEFSRKTSWELDLGTIIHACLLDPEGIEGLAVVIPDDVLNAQGHKKGKDWTAWKEEHAGLIHIDAKGEIQIARMLANTRANSDAMRLLEGDGVNEYTIAWTDPETGLLLRCRPDRVTAVADRAVAVEVKTCRDPRPRQFSGACFDFRYYRQAAFYLDGINRLGKFGTVSTFAFVAIQNAEPYDVVVYAELMPSDIELGEKENRQAICDLAHRLLTDDWTSPYSRHALTLRLPHWAYSNEWEIP